MCNIAGYVGQKQAAPILIDMIRQQEGLAGGFYTGLATIHEGKIHYAKLTGDLDRLLENTDAASLPGTVGIIHSRSKSGGGDAWAHPFVDSTSLDAPTVAYVANGAAAHFINRIPEYCKIAQVLEDSGFPASAYENYNNKNYVSLENGANVHMSDVMCQMIRRNMARGSDAVTAMTDAYLEMPGEIVGLLLSLTDPGKIVWSRINMPMNLAFCDHGAYLASAALCFPDDAGDPQLLPTCASGYVTANSLYMTPYKSKPATVAPITADLQKKAYDAVLEALANGPKTNKELSELVKELFPTEYDCYQIAPLLYQVYYALKKQGRLVVESHRVPGSAEGLTAPKFTMSLK